MSGKSSSYLKGAAMKSPLSLSSLARVKQLWGIEPEMKLSVQEVRAWYFKKISYIYSPYGPEYAKIEAAYSDTEASFHGEVRDNGDLYFNHLVSVSILGPLYLGVYDLDVIRAGLRHDSPEKFKTPLPEIARKDGMGVAELVDYCTKPALENFGGDRLLRDEAYQKRLWHAPQKVAFVKLPDVLNNGLTPWNMEKVIRKIHELDTFYIPWAEVHHILTHELKAALAELKALAP